jgi:structural maintenance of chromosome 2
LLEIEVLNNEVNGYNEDIVKLNQNLEGYAQSSTDINKQIEDLKEKEAKSVEQLEEHRDVIREKNRVIDSKSKECDKLNKEKNSIELKIKELEHKKSNLNEQLAQSIHNLERISNEHEWISQEKNKFNMPNSQFDFNKQNMKEVHHRLNEIKNRKDKMSKQVDVRAMGLLDKKKEEYEELNKKRTIVLKDRSTLENTIEDLEKIKTEVLINAFKSINKDLGNIFKTLLPGAFAKLEYANKKSLLDGVEFKVAFGDVWKESLTELSGGQRSLVALSLILSLLLYKPAPLYILDEVDAALDTSHTQNIGLMIKKYFKASQFVIVSLKDGMFNNANVLFKTKLIDGVSTIQRFETKRKEKEREHLALNDQTNIRLIS